MHRHMSARGWRRRLCITQKEPWSLAVEYIFDNRLDAFFLNVQKTETALFQRCQESWRDFCLADDNTEVVKTEVTL